MNKRGELEIAINKRTLERSVFLLVIVVLGVLLALKWNAGASPQTVEEITKLQQDLQTKTEENAQLQSELDTTKTALEEEKSKPAPEPVTPAPAVTAPPLQLSGTDEFSWKPVAEVQTPAMYNAAAIKTLQDEIKAIEEELEDADGGEKAQLEDELDEKQDKLDELERGDEKLRLKSVSLTAKNGHATEAEFDYLICWSSFDCTKVKSTGTLVVGPGESVTEEIDLKIPTILALDKTQILRLVITQDDEEVFKDDESFKA